MTQISVWLRVPGVYRKQPTYLCPNHSKQSWNNKMHPNCIGRDGSKVTRHKLSIHSGLTAAQCSMPLRKCEMALKQSCTLQLPMDWAIQYVKIETGSRIMRRRSSHCLLRNRRFTCKTWHVTCNKTKMAFLFVRPTAQENILQMKNILWPNVP